MRIVFIISGLSVGGAEMMLLKLLQHIDRSRFYPTVISLTTNGEIGPRIEALGIPVHTFTIRPRLLSLFKFIQLIILLHRLKPDIVHTWMYHANLIGGMAARLAGVRSLIWGVRNSGLLPGKTKRSTLWITKLCAKLSSWIPDKILFCSERAKTIHIDSGYCANKISLIPNGFELSRFTPDVAAKASVRAELKLDSHTLLVGLIGRADPQKNHTGFVTAAARVARTVPEVHFLLVGSGIDRDNFDLTDDIAKTSFGNRFHLLGCRDDIPRLMAALDLLVSSSWGEAFPNVLGEAMACKVPCVVTDVGDSANIVADTGRVVASGDMDGLARNMLELLSQPDLRSILGQRARQRVQEHYEIGKIARQYENYYLKLVERA